MEVIERLILWIILSSIHQVYSASLSSVHLNGPALRTEDLRAIDGYVSSGLPLFENTHGFVLHSGMRPVIVKVKDPNKVIRDGIEQPNVNYYRDLPSVIPSGFEGVASTSFLLGNPIPPLQPQAPTAGPVVNFHRQPFTMQYYQSNNYQQYQPIQMQLRSTNNQPMQFRSANHQEASHIAESSIRVENTLSPRYSSEPTYNEIRDDEQKQQRTNPVVVQTAEFESNLPNDFRNPFYSNQMLARTLAQASLQAPGEDLVHDNWETNKIQQGRVRDLLTAAGFI